MKSRKNLLVSLTTILFAITSIAQENEIENRDLLKKNYAQTIKDLRVCEKDNDTLTVAYNNCTDENPKPLQFWQTPGFAIGGYVVTFSAGAIFMATKCLGLCP